MPKTKATEVKKKIAPAASVMSDEIDEEKVLDPDLVLGDELIPGGLEDEDEDSIGLDDEEVDPFKDKWEE